METTPFLLQLIFLMIILSNNFNVLTFILYHLLCISTSFWVLKKNKKRGFVYSSKLVNMQKLVHSVVQLAFGCAQQPKAGQNTQQSLFKNWCC